MKYTIDATNRGIGRVSSEAASALIGKMSVNFTRNVAEDITVEILNSSKMKITLAKLEGRKKYTRYSGFPGGFKAMNLSEVIAKKGIAEAIRMSVRKMIPVNRLRVARMKKLIIKD